jgi:integrase
MPRKVLTAASIGRLKLPERGQIEYFDKGFPGLALRLSLGGARAWVLCYRAGGKARRLTLGKYPIMSLAEAREAWRTARREIAAGRDPTAKRPAIDFASIATEWLEKDQARNRSYKIVRGQILNHVVPAWQHRTIAEIAPRDVHDVLDAIVAKGNVITARRVHAYLVRLFKWCASRGIIERGNNPMLDLPKPGKETQRDRVLSDAELARVWSAAGELGWPSGDAVKLLILTGARREEVWRLRRDEVHGDEIRLVGARTKTGAPHTIPLSSAAKAVLSASAGGDYVFAPPGHAPRDVWMTAKVRFENLAPGLPGWTWHDLRRSLATGLERLGVPLPVTEAVLGHVSGSKAGVVGIYQRHSYDKEKRAALEAWGAHVTALIEGRAPGVVATMRGAR